MNNKYDLEKMVAILMKHSAARNFLDCCLQFEAIWKKTLMLRKFLSDNNYPPELRLEVVLKVMQKTVCRFFQEYIFLLLTNGDMAHFLEMTDRLYNLINDKFLIVKVIVSAPLSPEYLQKLQEILALKSSREVYLYQEKMAGILGGMIIVLRDSVIDLSIKAKLQQLKAVMG